MFNHVTRPLHFVLPGLFFVAGVWLMGLNGWFWGGAALYFVGICQTVWLTFSGMMSDRANYINEASYWYKTVHSLTDEEKIMLGLMKAKEKIEIEVDRTAENDGFYSKRLSFLSINPAKMKTIARSCLNGIPFSKRQWTGAGKLLSDREFDTLKAELLEVGMIKPRSEKDERQGLEWTDAGKEVLGEYLEEPLNLL